MSSAARHELSLTNRDIAILAMVFSYGGCGISHVQSRFFTSPGARSACYARVARLSHAGYLRGQRLPAASGQGSGPVYLTTGNRARPILAKLFNLSRPALRRQSRAKAPLFLHHELAIVDFRLSLELAIDASAYFAGVEWTPEWALRRHPLKAHDPKTDEVIPLVADGAFTLSRADGPSQHFLFELDTGTVSTSRLQTKLRGYLIIARDRPKPVLLVTSTIKRAQDITRMALEEARRLASDSTIFWVTTLDAITPDTIISAPVWRIAGGPAAFVLGQLASLGGAP